MSVWLSSYFGGSAVLWAFLALLQGPTPALRYHFSSLFVTGLITFGVIVGIAVGGVISHRRLRSIEKKVENTYSLSTILYVIGSLLIFISVTIIIAPRVPPEVSASAFLFVSPMSSACFSTLAAAFFNWERKHGQLIYSGMWSSKLYVYPKTEQPLQQ